MTHLTLDGLGGQGSPTIYPQEVAVEEDTVEVEEAEEEAVTKEITMTEHLGPS